MVDDDDARSVGRVLQVLGAPHLHAPSQEGRPQRVEAQTDAARTDARRGGGVGCG